MKNRHIYSANKAKNHGDSKKTMVLGVEFIIFYRILEKPSIFDYVCFICIFMKIAKNGLLSKIHRNGIKYENLGHI